MLQAGQRGRGLRQNKDMALGSPGGARSRAMARRVAEHRHRHGDPHGPGKAVSGRPVVLAVDGRSNAGKTTLAARIRRVVPGSAVVHTDDIAWEHSRFGWADLLIEGILVPVHQGRAVSFRPPHWAERGREGAVRVPAGCPLLVVEGVGAGRREAAHLLDSLIWVQSDEREAARRSPISVQVAGSGRSAG